MLTSRANFSLVSFGDERVNPTLYAQAERVYLESVGATAKTNTNEIAYWKDRYNAQFGKQGDRLFVFGLLADHDAIGFALVFYFKRHHLVVVDHIAIKDAARHFGAFFYFKEMMAQYIADQGLQVDYVLAEIVTGRDGDPHPIDAKLLIALLEQRGFKIVDMRYHTPSIKEELYTSRIETTLMLMRQDRGNQISSSELLALLECLLNELYMRWYSPHSKDLKGFRAQLDALLKVYRRDLKNVQFVRLNGEVSPEHTIPLLPKKPTPKSEGDGGIGRPVLLFVLVLLAAAFLAGISYLFGFSATLVMLLAATLVCLLLLGVWYRNAGSQADRIGRLLYGLLRNHKDVG
jgi:hypothetical protein